MELKTDEFTCICPKTGQPDFAEILIRYVPDQKIVESKSLKLYLWSFRDEGTFHEHFANRLLDDLVEALNPVGAGLKLTLMLGEELGLLFQLNTDSSRGRFRMNTQQVIEVADLKISNDLPFTLLAG